MTLMGVAALFIVLAWASADSVHAQTFNPTIVACLENGSTRDPRPFDDGDAEECDGDASAGAHSDFLNRFDVPSGDVNFGGAVFFIPPEWGITPGKDIPIGAIVGQLTALATLGLINGQCDSELTVVFPMLNSSLDITDTVAFDDSDDNGKGDVFEDKDGNGLQDVFEKYPEFITRIIGDAEPIRRAAGIEIVAGTDVLLQFLVFEPGTTLIREIPSDESMGYPTITLLQSIGDPDAVPEPGPITDFCTPLRASNITFGVSRDNPCTDAPGTTLDPLCDVKSSALEIPEEAVSEPDESGIPLFTNPAEGTSTFSAIALGQRDADGDGIENAFDTCPFEPNQGDPRIKGDGDVDEDGLDAACDPNDDEVNSDQDLDGYLNRQDNCPLIANGEQEDNQKDDDVNDAGDPRPDGIGNACDPNPQVPDGDLILAQATSDVTIGPGTAPTPTGSPSASDGDDGGSSSTIIIIIAVIAGVVVLGGGGFYFMRRRGGGGATT